MVGQARVDLKMYVASNNHVEEIAVAESGQDPMLKEDTFCWCIWQAQKPHGKETSSWGSKVLNLSLLSPDWKGTGKFFFYFPII